MQKYKTRTFFTSKFHEGYGVKLQQWNAQELDPIVSPPESPSHNKATFPATQQAKRRGIVMYNPQWDSYLRRG